MTIPVVIMIIIGIIFIFVSFFVSEKLFKKEQDFNIDLLTVDEDYEFSDRERQIIKRKIEDVIAKQAKDILYETNESLSTMANEKTLALGDYAVTVCEEIEKNHKEVMFLYSMLDDKQKEIINTVKVVDEEKNKVQELLSESQKYFNNNIAAKTEPLPKESAKQRSTMGQLAALSKMKEEAERRETEEKDQNRILSEKTKKTDELEKHLINQPVTETSSLKKKYKKDMIPTKASGISETDIEEKELEEIDIAGVFAEIDKIGIDFNEALEEEFEENSNSNDLILELYENGSSIIEIAKQLGLGVGEVKLVIDLYQGE